MHAQSAPNPAIIASVLLVLVLYVIMVKYCIEDLYRPERRVLGFTKDVWAVIIVCLGVIGWMAYLFYGRENT